MRYRARLTAVAMLACAFAMPAAGVDGSWMTEAAMRAAFIGKTLDGHYVDGVEWTETYDAGGRLDYRESTKRAGAGHWFFRGRVFCTFYDPGQGLNGGCFTAVQASANCFEFYVADLRQGDDGKDAGPGPTGKWVARAWRRGEPSTCEGRPPV
jgi:hypothetical protein